MDEYSVLIKDETNDQMLVLRKEHSRLSNKLKAVQEMINSLYLRYNKDICDMLNMYGFRIRYTEETLIDDLKKTAIAAKQWVIQRDEAAKELNKFVSGKKNTEADYDMYLTVLSKFIGYRIDKHVCTISEYAGIRNNYEAEVKRIEELLNKNNHG